MKTILLPLLCLTTVANTGIDSVILVNELKQTKTTILENTQQRYNEITQQVYETENNLIHLKSYVQHDYINYRTNNTYEINEERTDIVKITAKQYYEGYYELKNDINLIDFNIDVTVTYLQYAIPDTVAIDNQLKPLAEAFLNAPYSTSNYSDIITATSDLTELIIDEVFDDYLITNLQTAQNEIDHTEKDIDYYTEPKYYYLYQYIEIRTGYSDDILENNKIVTRNMAWQIEEQTEHQGIVVNYETLDIAGLMFTILGMPFAWISTAFNLTLFPGTPYAINIATILFTVLGALIAIWIIKRFIK